MIDDGKNPDEFTRDVLNSCIVKNQITKGKTDAFKVWNYGCIGFSQSLQRLVDMELLGT